jgi:hypothetical protein
MRAAAAALLAWTAGCGPGAAPSVDLERRAADIDPDAIEAGPVRGVVAGTPFRAVDARVRVVRFPGRERVELWLAESRFEHCGLRGRDEGRRLFVRFPGVTELPEALVRIDPGDSQATGSVHFEVPDGRRWRGVGRAAAVLRVDGRGDGGMVRGRLEAWFDDGAGSRVAGRFRAVPCGSPVDGAALRELPEHAPQPIVPDRPP